MILKSIGTSGSVFESPFVICGDDSPSDPDQTWITVLVGENGSKKSLALRVLMDAGLGKTKHRGHGHPPIEFTPEFAGPRPSNVIAISNTPWDRFPRGYELSKLSTLVSTDGGRFVYIGQRAGTGNVSLRNNEKQLGYSFIENAGFLGERAADLEPIFSKLGLELCAGIRFVPNRTIGLPDSGPWDQALNRYLSKLPAIVRQLQRDRSIPAPDRAAATGYAKFLLEEPSEVDRVRALLKSLAPSKIAFWLRPGAHKILFGYNTILEWRYLLHLGLIEIEGISLLPLGKKHLADKASEAKRDSDLSSGQWNWLFNFSNLLFELRDDSLVLVDEPENSLHPSWQREYLPTLQTVLSTRIGCHAIIATHSALIAAGLSNSWGSIRRLEASEARAGAVRTRSLESTFAWSSNDVYQDVFGMESSRAPEFMQAVDQLLELISSQTQENANAPEWAIAYLRRALEELPTHDAMRNIVAAILRHFKQGAGRE
jgi:hypothetical protein